MPKVALIVHQFPSQEHPYILAWAKELVRAGINLTIFSEQPAHALSFERSDADDDFWTRVRLLNSLNHPPESLLINWLKNLRGLFKSIPAFLFLLKQTPEKFLTALRKLYEYLPLLSEKYDIVHFNAPQLAVRRFELGRLLGGKTIVSFRGQDFSFHPERYDRLLQEADHLHFISQDLLKSASARGYTGTHHTLIPPLVDTAFYTSPSKERRKNPSDPWLLFSAARFTWVKGWEYALQAVALLVEKGWDIHYAIAGDGDLRPMLAYTIHDLNLSKRVHLLGWLTPEEVRDWMQKADLYLLTSVNEGFNNSVLQAQACGLPVVCSDAGGLPENIVDGVTGLLFRRRDAWELAENISSLLGDSEKRAVFSQDARKHAMDHYSVQKVLPEFIGMYQSVCS